jgi:hypothetical protein
MQEVAIDATVDATIDQFRRRLRRRKEDAREEPIVTSKQSRGLLLSAKAVVQNGCAC